MKRKTVKFSNEEKSFSMNMEVLWRRKICNLIRFSYFKAFSRYKPNQNNERQTIIFIWLPRNKFVNTAWEK